ncbi:MAG: CHASE2 domain-containing protein [Proteobacteria bacterium]|nr:CHASE2 domain-containing protein [Pseudomonadota bacterium]
MISAGLLSLLSLFLQSTALVEDWETRFQSNHYLLRSVFSQPEAASIPLVLVLIDDNSLPEGTTRSPIDRRFMARLISKLADHEPATIGVDILFDRPGKETHDRELASAIEKAGNVVLRSDPYYPALRRFSKAALDQGTVRFRLDSSGTLQEICNSPLTCQSSRMFHRNIWNRYRTTIGRKKSDGIFESSWLKINFEPVSQDSSSHKTLNYPIIRASDVVDLPEHSLRGKLVLVGTGFLDLYPLYRTPVSFGDPSLQETEILAQVLHMMAGDNYLEKVPGVWIGLSLALVLFALSFILVYVGALSGLLISLVSMAGIFVLAGSAFAFGNLEVPTVLPILLIAVFTVSGLVFQTVQEKFRRLETEIQLKQSKIDFLTNELHSHHLFNEFSRLSVMIRQNPESARDYLVEFAEMLRASLKYGDQTRVPVDKQLEYLQAYIRQQQIVYQKRLEIEMTAEGDWEDIGAPWHVFFPLLENAVKHSEGLLRKSPDATLTIIATLTRSHEAIVFSVQNPFDKEIEVPSSRTGLKNLKERLEWSYPKGGFKLEHSQKDRDWTARLQLPV